MNEGVGELGTPNVNSIKSAFEGSLGRPCIVFDRNSPPLAPLCALPGDVDAPSTSSEENRVMVFTRTLNCGRSDILIERLGLAFPT